MTFAICFWRRTHRKSFSIQNQVSPCFQEFPSPRTPCVRPKPYSSTLRHKKHVWPFWKRTISASCTSSATAATAWSAIFIWASSNASFPACKARLSISVWNAPRFCISSMSSSNAAIRTKPNASNTCSLKVSLSWFKSSKTPSTPKAHACPPKSHWPAVSSSIFRKKTTSAFPNASRMMPNAAV